MTIGRYRVDGEALLGRIIFCWHWKLALASIVLLGLGGVLSGAIPPVWRGEAFLTVQADPQATILVDGKAWPFPVYAGRHRIEARYADGRRSWTQVVLKPQEERLVALPQAAHPPRVRTLPPPAPGSVIKRIWWADNGWRVQSGPSSAEPSPSPGAMAYGEEPVAVLPEQTVAFTSTGLEPLSTLDAYGGKADVLQHDGRRLEAVFRADTTGMALGSTQVRGGILEVRNWRSGHVTVPVSHTVTMVRWSPHGTSLLVGEQLTTDAEHLNLLQLSKRALQAVVAIPGRIENIIWSPAGNAAVVISQREQRVTLTMVRTAPTVASRVIAEVDRPAEQASPIGGVVPLSWSDDQVEWIAPDEAGRSYLWRARVAMLIPEQVQPLAALAIQRDADGAMQVLDVVDGRLVLGRVTPDSLIVEAEVPEIPVTSELVGHWSPNTAQILIQSATRTWIVDLEVGSAATAEGAS
jgi:hypothetical protein